MSDSVVLAKLRISQGQRFYEWSTDGRPPIPLRDIETQSANMHMVPADESVERTLMEARAGNIVKLSGYLIDARAPDGFRMRSSLTRQDIGPGACEVIWVERIELH
jgi:3-mercaptopyruvate sulfurtransferase SseA